MGGLPPGMGGPPPGMGGPPPGGGGPDDEPAEPGGAEGGGTHTPQDTFTRYDEEKDEIEYLFDMDEMVDDPRDSGRATQCKIHYSFAPSMGDGIMYMASHLSGPPIDLPAYSPWGMWHNEERCFRGSALLAFDTKTDDASFLFSRRGSTYQKCRLANAWPEPDFRYSSKASALRSSRKRTSTTIFQGFHLAV